MEQIGRFCSCRTVLKLKFIEKQAKKTSEEDKRRKKKGDITKIQEYLLQYGKSKINDIVDYIYAE